MRRTIAAALGLLVLLFVSDCARKPVPGTAKQPPPAAAGAKAPGQDEEKTHRFLAAEPTCGVHCGTERWRVKTLAGTGADGVNFQPQAMTVKQLVAAVPPATLSDTLRETDIEKQTATVQAILIGYKRESDSDLHIVLGDLNDPEVTMIVEIPDADRCSFACNSAHADDFRSAKAAFLGQIEDHQAQKCFRQMQEDGVELTVTGVPMFDRAHGQTGAAENGMELHPVLKVEWPTQATHAASCSM